MRYHRFDRKNLRLREYDYSRNGFYFVTICTKGMCDFFGAVRNGVMGLNELGCAVARFWNQIPVHFPDVVLDEWVVMPNHVHGVLFINKPDVLEGARHEKTGVGARHGASLHVNRFGSLNPQSLSCIINHFKGAVTRNIHKNYDPHFSWQPRYYDHIVRNENSLNCIRSYIQNNPMNWKSDIENRTHHLSSQKIRSNYDHLFNHF